MNDDTPLETGEGDALPYAPPAVPEEATAALGLLNALEKRVDEYLQGYELCGDAGNYTPNSTERLLITDAVNGLLTDDEFIKLFEAWRHVANDFRALLVPPPGLTFGKVGKKMSFSVGTQSFVLDFEPEEPGEFEFMALCLRKAFAALLSKQPAQAEAPSEPVVWRDLALQFDGHRMQALGWLKLIVRELPQTPAWVGLRHFLASPPLSGEAVLADRIAALAAQQPTQADGFDTYNSNGLAWAVSRWNDEVSQRPFLNVHRRTLDDVWRQVVRFFGGDPDALLGPAHDALVARQQHIGGNG